MTHQEAIKPVQDTSIGTHKVSTPDQFGSVQRVDWKRPAYRSASFIAAVAMATVLAGCGGNDTDPSAAGPSEAAAPTQAERIEELSAQTAHTPEDPGLYVSRGELYRKQREYDLALADYERAIAFDARHCAALSGKGFALRQLNRFAESRDQYEKALEYCPDDGEIRGRLAYVLHLMGESEAALEEAAEAIRRDPKSYVPQNYRGLILLELDRLDEAMGHFDRAIELQPEKKIPWYNRGRVHMKRGELELALQQFDESIRLDPSYWHAYVNRGFIYGLLGQHAKSIEDYTRAIQLRPEKYLPYANRAQQYMEQDRRDDALRDANKAIELNACSHSYQARGSVYEQVDDFDAAMRDYRQAANLDPRDASLQNSIAAVQFQTGDLESALATLSHAIELDERHGKSLVDRAVIHRKQSRNDAALEDLDRAISLNDHGPLLRLNQQEFARAYEIRAKSKRDEGDFDEALSDVEQAIALSKGDPSPHLTQGDIYAEIGLLNRALASYRQAARADANSWSAHYSVGVTCSEIGDIEDAISALMRAIEVDATDARAWNDRGACWGKTYSKSGDPNALRRAASDFREAMRLNPQDASVQKNLRQAERFLSQEKP